jgi:two-component system response regulator HupR/HoxA
MSHIDFISSRNLAASPAYKGPSPPSGQDGFPTGRDCFLDRIVRAPDSPLNDLCDQLAQVAPHDIPVLLSGESGTGKELFARALHDLSPRASKPFVAENCAAMPGDLLESELFGHRKGAFTGAVRDHKGLFLRADGGTIFLDEIGEVSPSFQAKLLRILQEGELRPVGATEWRKVNVRVVAATNRDLELAKNGGHFREDLYFRLAGMQIHLPPLRERRMDIPIIANCLLQEAMVAFGKSCQGFTPEALAKLAEQDWPGNVRELRNVIQRMLLTSQTPLLGVDLLARRVTSSSPLADKASPEPPPILEGTLKERLKAMEAYILRETLIRHQGNAKRAAKELGLPFMGLRAKLVFHGLETIPIKSSNH